MTRTEQIPSISLLVCTTARSDWMDALGARLSAAIDEAGFELEAVVVDNSREGGLVFSDSRIRVVRCGLPGISRARTTGMVNTRAQVIVCTDDDVDFPPDWPQRMAGPILDGSLDATAAPVKLGSEFDGVTSVLQRSWLAEGNLDGKCRLIGAGMAIDRQLLGFALFDERIGAGRPDFAFGEETLFEYMIEWAGARIGVVGEATVIHHPDPTRATAAHFRTMARQKGLSGAYLGYHWFGESMRRPAARSLRSRLRLRQHRSPTDEVSQFELELIEALGRADGFRLLGSEPRSYYPRTAARLR